MATTKTSNDDPKSDVAATTDSTVSSQATSTASETSKATSTAKSASSQAVSAATSAASTAKSAAATKDAPTPVPDDGGYIVQQGDDIATVATVHRVSVGWVKFVNNLGSNVLKVGRTIYFELRG
ncbi:LysM peptidoglycan-binding domain-containing protein [Lacticaseibacillus saniviri]|uniref:LysM domain-containing protein n=1 Tax=Lacticaseibacillus saniviri JCM 17471 = DSM 24301 TaxID=1293598 RepID=A0A0R2MQK2_9LACO|nr:LysM domain-containing protein [Lacticaseibacillus saniviri]KRO15895.1 hypothetical protein IV56_GL002085 [Lacticaseibacillus saniviri JCM 17471 = DSM 24301]